MQWCEKYAPNTLKEFAGNPSAIGAMLEWAKNPKNPLLLVGAPGTGKTTSAYTLAKQFSWDVLEMNAGMLRSKKEVERVAGMAGTSKTVLGTERLILFDEVDLMFRKDSGGASAVLSVVRNAKCPVILTCNDLYATSLRAIRKECTQVKFKKVHYSTIAKTLMRICVAQGVQASEKDLVALARAQAGDLKSAINDLQAAAQGKQSISLDDFKVVGERDREQNVFSAMAALFHARTVRDANNAFRECKLDPNMFLAWVEENIPRHYKGEDVANGFEALAKADIYRGRIMRRQSWGLLKFAIMMGSSGVALVREDHYPGYTAFQFPGFIRRLSASKARRALRTSIARKIGRKTHSSTSNIIKSLPLLAMLFKHKDTGPGLIAKFNINEKELGFLGFTPAKAKKFVAQAQKLRAIA